MSAEDLNVYRGKLSIYASETSQEHMYVLSRSILASHWNKLLDDQRLAVLSMIQIKLDQVQVHQYPPNLVAASLKIITDISSDSSFSFVTKYQF